MAQRIIIVNGYPTTVEETSPDLFGKLGYQYASNDPVLLSQQSSATASAYPKVGEAIPGTNLAYEQADITNPQQPGTPISSFLTSAPSTTSSQPVSSPTAVGDFQSFLQTGRPDVTSFSEDEFLNIYRARVQGISSNDSVLRVRAGETFPSSQYDSAIKIFYNELKTSGNANQAAQIANEEASVARNVSTLDPSLQSLYQQLNDYIKALTEQGMAVNPAIEITPEKIQEFLNQAKGELGPYYQGEISSIQTDLKRSLEKSALGLGESEEDLARQFTKGFTSIGEKSAERGIALSGVRQRQEAELAEEANRQVQRQRQNLQFGAETASLQAERALGSANLGNFQFPALSGTPRFTSEGQFYSGEGSTTLGRLQGGIFGSLPQEQLTSERSRALELEGLFRQEQEQNALRDRLLAFG